MFDCRTASFWAPQQPTYPKDIGALSHNAFKDTRMLSCSLRSPGSTSVSSTQTLSSTDYNAIWQAQAVWSNPFPLVLGAVYQHCVQATGTDRKNGRNTEFFPRLLPFISAVSSSFCSQFA